MKQDKKNILWYDNSTVITNMIIGLICVIILLSQSFAINNNLSSTNILRDIINHNINYIVVLLYFVGLKFNFGKKYFNYFNVFLVFLYSIFTITSSLSIFQAFSIPSLLSLAIKVIILVYLVHTMFRDTSYFKELNIIKSPFNDISNDNYFSAILVMALVLLAFNLIQAYSFDGTVISLLDTAYIILLGRYIYLYREYLEIKTIIKLKKSEEKEGEK